MVEVEVLHLHHNLLSFVANSTFTPLVNLRVLSLHNNKLAQIALPPALVSVMSYSFHKHISLFPPT